MTTQNNLPLIWASGGGQTDPGAVKYVDGWVAEIPTFQNFNYVLSNSTKNILVQAEQGIYNWEDTITYQEGAKVLVAGIKYLAKASNTGQDPSLDTNNNYWVTGEYISSFAGVETEQSEGFKIDRVYRRVNGSKWEGNDLTLHNGVPNIFFRNDIGATNWLLNNINGSMCFVDVGTANLPDGRDIYQNHPDVHRIFHEGHLPDVTEVTDAVEEVDKGGSKLYARKDGGGGWVEVTSTVVQLDPPPPVQGAGQGWFNLTDGRFYLDINDGDSSQWVPASPPVVIDPEKASSAEVDAGTEDDKFITPAALAGSSVGKVVQTVIESSNAAWTPNPLAKSIEFIVVGGGGGGGGVDGQGSGTAACASAGSSGAVAIKTANVESVYALVVGSGGSGGAAGDNDGGAGGTSSVTSVNLALVAEGGQPGRGVSGISSFGNGINPGSGLATGGDINFNGSRPGLTLFQGGYQITTSTSALPAYIGGTSTGSGGYAAGAGKDGLSWGCSGNGADTRNVTTNHGGGAGYQGVILIKEYL